MKKYIALAASATLAVTMVAPAANAATLSDIKGSPYETAIKALVEKGIISGYTDGTYKPTKALTRSDVVILLGKYLEKQGYKVPSDYKTKMRFSDLTPKSNNSLLKYAALVKDNGIFFGGDGKLMYNELLSHHHAALVLVRTFALVNNQSYLSEKITNSPYNDTAKLDDSSKAALQIFSDLGIVSGQYFKPTSQTTRGEFAHYLYELMENLTTYTMDIKSIQVLDANKLYVTLHSGYSTTINLQTPLKKNTPQEVNFTIYGEKYKETVTYQVAIPFEVESVKNLNASQFEIHFNEAVQLENLYLQSDIAKLMTLTPRDSQGTPTLVRAQLSEDKKTLTVTVDASYTLKKRYYLSLNGVKSVNGSALTYVRQAVTFTEDKTAPTIVSTEQIALNKVKVKFSEPVRSYYSTGFTLANGTYVYGISQTTTLDPTEVIFDLSQAMANGVTLATKTDVTAKLTNVTDYQGNVATTLSTKIRKTDALTDGIKPNLLSVEQVGARKFKLTFSEPMKVNNLYNVIVYQNTGLNIVEEIEQDPENENSYIFTTEDFLDGKVTIQTRNGYYVYDLSGMTNTISTSPTFKYDATSAKVERSEVVREENNEYLYVYFDRYVELDKNAKASIEGTYTINGKGYPLAKALSADIYGVSSSKKAIRILLSDLLKGIDRENVDYTVDLALKGVSNDYGVALNAPATIQFERTKDYMYNANQLKVVSVDTSRSSASIKKSNTILVTFNHDVDVESATKLENYDLGSYEIVSAVVNKNNLKQVELTVKEGAITNAMSKYLSIENIRAANSVYKMTAFDDEVYFHENVKPYITDYVWNTSGVSTITSSVVTGTREITITYNEALAEPASNLLIVKDSDGQVISSQTTLAEDNNHKLVLKFDENLPRNKQITIQIKSNRALTDIYYNSADFQTLQLTVPSYLN